MPEGQPPNLPSLAAEEFERLLSIAGEAQAFLLHDLVNVLGFLKIKAQQLERHFTEHPEKPNADENSEAAHDISSAAQEIERGIRRLTLGGWRTDEVLTTSLSVIADLVAKHLSPQVIRLLPSTPPELRVQFPSNALYAIVYELARNACIHAPNSPVGLEWSFQPSTLLVSVHDAGTSLSHLLSDKLLALEVVDPQLLKPRGGLSIVRRIAHRSGGLLLIRRSQVFGGAEISVRLPVSAYSVEETS